jgi:phosphomannomutase
VHYDDGAWVLLLPSKEFELFHVFVEAHNEQRAAELAREFEEKVVRWRDND